jgi:hypothetical protein
LPAGYLVTNEMPYPVFLGGRTLTEGGRGTWSHGARLQPTASTVLVLYVDEPGEGLGPAGRGVVAVPPAGAGGGARRVWCVVLACLGLCLAGLLLGGVPAPPAARSPTQVQADYVRAREQLLGLERDPGRAPEARRLLALLADARYFEAWGRPQEALQLPRAAGRGPAPCGAAGGARLHHPAHRRLGRRWRSGRVTLALTAEGRPQ